MNPSESAQLQVLTDRVGSLSKTTFDIADKVNKMSELFPELVHARTAADARANEHERRIRRLESKQDLNGSAPLANRDALPSEPDVTTLSGTEYFELTDSKGNTFRVARTLMESIVGGASFVQQGVKQGKKIMKKGVKRALIGGVGALVTILGHLLIKWFVHF